MTETAAAATLGGPMSGLTLVDFLVLLSAGLAAGTVDAIAGGGGLIALPAMLSTGLPVPVALGTNKLGAIFGTSWAVVGYSRRGAVDVRECVRGILFTAAGAVVGAQAVNRMDTAFLSRTIPWVLGVLVLYMALRPTLGETDRHHRLDQRAFYAVFGLGLGFYDGFFGPGVGSFWTLAFVMVLGHNFLRAAGHTKVMNLTSNIAALAVFAWHGQVALVPACVLGAGQVAGAQIGTHLAVTRGARFVRPIFLIMAGLTVAKLIYQHYFRS